MSTRMKRGANSITYTVIVIALILIVNLISYKNHERVDLSLDSSNSLSKQSFEILNKLDSKITVTAFVKPEANYETNDLLEQYAFVSEKFDYQLIDPDKNPGAAKKYGVTEYDTIVVESSNGKRNVINGLSEEKVTNAIYQATLTKTPIIYFVTGHGERAIDDDKPQGYLGTRKALQAAGYEVKPLNWFTSGSIPEDASMVVIGGPAKDFQAGEAEKVKDYLAKGGSLLLALDPGQYRYIPEIVKSYGISFIYDAILDPVSQKLGLEPLVATATEYGESPIVAGFELATFFPLARSILTKEVAGVVKTVVARGSVDTWSETDIASLENSEPLYDEGVDPPGPRQLLVTAEWETGPAKEKRKIGAKGARGRVVVVGDSDFAANNSLSLGGNKDLMLNIAGWLTNDDNRVLVRNNRDSFQPILFEEQKLTIAMWLFVVAMPATLILLGLFIRYKRNRG